MTAFDLDLPDGSSRALVLRRLSVEKAARAPGAASAEFRLLQALSALALPVPAPVLLDESRAIFETPFLVVSFIEGEPIYAPDGITDRLPLLARQLAAIHAIRADRPEFGFLAGPTGSLDERYPARPGQRDFAFDERHVRIILAEAWPRLAERRVALVHGDYWPGNVLWRAGRIAGVIDWEDAEAGEPLCDLAIARLDLSWIFGRDAMESFTAAYVAATGADLADLPLWDLCAALRLPADLADWAEGWPDMGRPDITEATMREGHARFVTQALDARPTP